MPRQWIRTTRWAVLGSVMIVLASGGAGRVTAGGGSGFPAVSWAGATWRDSTPQERQGYVLGITDGLRLATVFDRAQVDRSAVMDCVQGLRAETLARLIERHLDGVEVDEPTLPFHLWDALVATCFERATRAGGPRGNRDTEFWVFVSLQHPTSTSRPYLTQVACEAARRTRERSGTLGCYRESRAVTGERLVAPDGPRGIR